jgi:hypothetical protein
MNPQRKRKEEQKTDGVEKEKKSRKEKRQRNRELKRGKKEEGKNRRGTRDAAGATSKPQLMTVSCHLANEKEWEFSALDVASYIFSEQSRRAI